MNQTSSYYSFVIIDQWVGQAFFEYDIIFHKQIDGRLRISEMYNVTLCF